MTSNAATLTVDEKPEIISQPSVSGPVCEESGDINIEVTAGGTGITYQWEVSTDDGVNWAVVDSGTDPEYSGEDTNILTISDPPLSWDDYAYRVIISGVCSPSVTSNSAIITVNPEPVGVDDTETVCSDVSLNYDIQSDNIDILGNGVTSLFTYTVVSSDPANVPAASDRTTPSDAPITDTYTNTTSSAVDITYTITPVSDPEGCVGTDFTYTVTVNPEPVLSDYTVSGGVCSDIAIGVDLDTDVYSGGIAADSYTIHNINVASGLTPEPGNASTGTGKTSGAISSDIFTNTTNGDLDVVYDITGVSSQGCESDMKQVTVTIKSEPVGVDEPITICSDDALSYDLQNNINTLGNNQTSDFIWVATDNPNISGESTTSVSSGLIDDILVNVTSSNENVIYTVTPTGTNGCSGDDFIVTVTVKPRPQMSITDSAPEICEGERTNLTLNSPTDGAVITLTAVDYAGGNISGGSLSPPETYSDGQKIRETLYNETSITQTVEYTFTVEANGCGPLGPFTETVDIKPNPVLTITNNATSICEADLTDIDLTVDVAGASIELVAVTPSDPSVGGYTMPGAIYSSGDKIQDDLTNSSNTDQSVEYTFRTTANGCVESPDKSTSVTIKPTPDVSVSGIDICSGNVTDIDITNPNNVQYTSFSWVVEISNPDITGAKDGSGDHISQELHNTSSSPQSITYRVTPSAVGCVGPYEDYVQTVNPGNTVDAGSDVTVCEDTSPVEITDASIGGGATTSTWSIVSGSGTIVDPNDIVAEYEPAAGEVGTVTLELKASDPSSCPDVVDYVDIEINRRAIVEAGSDQVICEGDNAELSEASRSGSASSVTWSGGLGIFSPNETTTNATYIPDPSEAGTTVRLYITSNDPDGPCDPAVDSLDITINIAPTVYAGADKVICEGDSAHLTDATLGGSASSITWSGGSGTFVPDNTTLDASYIPASSEVGTEVTLTITTDDPDGSGPCSPVSDQVKITVNKGAEVFAGTDKVICEGDNASMSDASISGSASSVTWTGGLGSFSPNNTTLNVIYEPDPSETGSVVTLRLTTNDPPGPCKAVFDEADVTINVAAQVSAGSDKEVCGTDSVYLDDASIGGSTSDITWSGGEGDFYPDPSTLNAVYLPDSSEIGTTVTLTITTNDPVGPCGAVFDHVDVKVNRAPEVDAGSDQVICEGSNVSLNGSISGGASSATWSGGLGTFSDNTQLNTTYIPDDSEVGTIVTLRLTTNDPSGPCTAAFDEMDATINEAPTVDAGPNDAICIGDTAFLAGSIGGTATSATWSGGEGEFSDVNDLDAYYLPDTTERGSEVILTLTTNDPDGSGPCKAVEDKVFITVNALPNPYYTGLDPQIAINAPPVELDGFPQGGDFAGDGIEDGTNVFNPFLAGEGEAYITYTYTDVNGCTNDYLDSTFVNPKPLINIIGLNAAVCENGADVPLEAFPEGGRFEGTGVIQKSTGDYEFSPFSAGVGEHLISYIFTDPNTNVTDTTSQPIKVLPVPEPAFSVDPITCVDSLVQFTDLSIIDASDSIVSWIWKFGDNSEDTVRNPQHKYDAAGTYQVSLRAYSKGQLSTQCNAVVDLSVKIGAKPDVEFSARNFVLGDITEFTDETTFIDGLFDDRLVQWSWVFDDGNTSNMQNPTHQYSNSGRFAVQLEVLSERGCVDRDTSLIAIIPEVTSIDPEMGYVEDFEAQSAWIAEPLEDAPNSWEYGTPAGSVIDHAASGQYAWVTDLDTTYLSNERSWLKSPAFNLDGLTRPMVQFDYWINMNTADGATFEYSIDGGVTWRLVGTLDEVNEEEGEIPWPGINWYQNQIFNVLDEDQGVIDNEDRVGWTGQTNGWTTARIYLDPIIERHGYPNHVIFRFGFASRTNIGEQERYEGFALDNFVLKNRTRNVFIEQFANFNSEDTRFFVRDDMYEGLLMDLTYEDRNATDVAYVEYHHRGSSEGDAVYKDNVNVAQARTVVYGQSNVSNTRITYADGIIRSNQLIDKYTILLRALIDPKFDIDFTIDEGNNLDPEEDQVVVNINLTAGQDINEEGLILYTMLIEDEIKSYRTEFPEILAIKNLGRQMFTNVAGRPSGSGIPLDSVWNEGQTRSEEITGKLEGFRQDSKDNFKVAVFVQNINTKEIYQVVIRDVTGEKDVPDEDPNALEDEIAKRDLQNLNIYPQPAKEYAIVDFGRKLMQDYIWEIIDQRGVTIGRGTVKRGEEGFEIDTSLLPNGIHFLLMGDKSGLKMHRKLTIIH